MLIFFRSNKSYKIEDVDNQAAKIDIILDQIKNLNEEYYKIIREFGITTVADIDELIREADALELEDDEALEEDLKSDWLLV